METTQYHFHLTNFPDFNLEYFYADQQKSSSVLFLEEYLLRPITEYNYLCR